MKKLLLLAVMMLAGLSFSYAQYKYDASFPAANKADTLLMAQSLHGVAVGPDGNVWPGAFGALKGDSLADATTGAVKAILALHVYKPDGSEASFSPIKILKGGAVNDTLWASGKSWRGLATAADGNILVTYLNIVYLLDYRNGAVITKIVPIAGSGTAAATDVAGNIYTAPVSNNAAPLQMFNKAGVKQGNVTDTTRYFSRSITVSRAGDKVYFAGYTGHCVTRYTGDPLLGYAADTVLKGFDCEAIGRSGKTDLLWAASGSGNDKPNQYPGVTTSYSSHTWYLWDPATSTIKDSIKWNGLGAFTNADSAAVRPRGVSTSTNGDTVYVVMFGSKTGVYSIQRFVKGSSAVKRDEGTVASSYTLGQNYPNPFNPSTTIRFSLPQASNISLKVFDVLGKEVATLAEGRYEAGSFTATFDAKNMNSGVYFYTLRASNGFTQSAKMLLMK